MMEHTLTLCLSALAILIHVLQSLYPALVRHPWRKLLCSWKSTVNAEPLVATAKRSPGTILQDVHVLQQTVLQ